jgi:Derlin-2/3
VQLQIVSPTLLYLNLRSVTTDLEVWRLLTNVLFFGGFGMPFVFNMFFLVRYSAQLEEQKFAGKSADYVCCLAFCTLVLTLATAAMGNTEPFLSQALLSSVVYLWSRVNPTQPLSIFGLFTVQAFYFPWVLVAMSVLMGSSPVPNVLGIVAGHVYYFLTQIQGLALSAPRFLCARRPAPAARRAPTARSPPRTRCIYAHVRLHPRSRAWLADGRREALNDGPRAPEAANRGNFGRHNWGGGRRLDG